MKTPQSPHPDDQILKAYGLGKLDDGPASTVNDHLEDCPDCRQRLSGLTSDSFLGRFREAHQPSARSIPAGSLVDSTMSFLQAKVASPPPPTDTLPPGLANHPDYEIKRELGRGGMGVVYLAHNAMMGRDEVLKVMGRHIMERPGVLERFQREIRAVAKLRHPNIVAAHAAFRIEGGLVFAMEYVEGLDLSRLVKAKGPLPVAHAAYFIHQAALGLQHAHEKGLIHRDIKPHNLMLTHDGKARLIKVLDFGLAKATREQTVDGGLTSEGQALGTPDYIAPEQIVNALDVDIRADLYSLGGTLFYLLAGRPPFLANSLYDIYQAHMSRDADPLNLIRPEVPAELAALVNKVMAKDPNRRFQTPGELANALTPFFKPSRAEAKTIHARATTKASRMVEGPATTQQATMPPQPTAREGRPAEPLKTDWGTLIDFREPEPIPAQAIPADSRRIPRWAWPAISAAALAGMLLIGVVIKLNTPDGTIVLEGVPEDAEVVVDGAKIRLTWPGVDKPIEIRAVPGQHRVQVEKDGFQAFGESVSIARGGRENVTVRLERLAGDRQVPDRPIIAGSAPGNDGLPEPGTGSDTLDRPVERTAPTPSVKTAGPPVDVTEDGFQRLFNGKDLTGWKVTGNQDHRWRVVDGAIVSANPPTYTSLKAMQPDFDDFHLRVETRLAEGNDAAIDFRDFRTKDSEDVPGFYATTICGSMATGRRTGDLDRWLYDQRFELAKASAVVPIQPGEWFTQEVIAVGDTVTVLVKGKEVVKYKDPVRNLSSGSITLFCRAESTAMFRKVEIKKLPRFATDPPRMKPDLLQVGTVWIGERSYRKGGHAGKTTSYFLHIRERNGWAFRGHKFSNGEARNRLEVVGEFDGSAIRWSERYDGGTLNFAGTLAGDSIDYKFDGVYSNGVTTEGDGKLSLRETTHPATYGAIFAAFGPGFPLSTRAVGERGLGLEADYRGVRNVLRTHPVSRSEPCTLRGRVALPAGRSSKLVLDVAHHPQGDWKLVVKADGETLREVEVSQATTGGNWWEVVVDLSKFAGKTVKLELSNQATEWRFEFGYWSKIAIIF